MTIAVVVLVENLHSPVPVEHRVCPLVLSLQMVGIVGPMNWINYSFPAEWQLISLTLGEALWLGQSIHWIDPSGGFVFVVDVEVSVAPRIICLFPVQG